MTIHPTRNDWVFWGNIWDEVARLEAGDARKRARKAKAG